MDPSHRKLNRGQPRELLHID